jgi:nicotinamide-nucleotide amidase
MTESNRVQAMFPEGSEIVPNPHGTAPGIFLTAPREHGGVAHVFALPGVPAEMREMWVQTVQPTLIRLQGDRCRVLRHQVIKCFGVGESDLEQMLPNLIARGRIPTVGITVSQATISLRISADAESEEQYRSLVAPTIEVIHRCLGELVFGEEEDELQHAVVRLLRAKQQTLATVEWGSGGLLARWLSEADAEGNCYVGGRVLRRLPSYPGGQPDVEALVRAAAADVRTTLQADYCLAVGPFPPAVSQSEAQYVALAVDSEREKHGESVRYAGHPDLLHARCTKQALNLLRLRLMKVK